MQLSLKTQWYTDRGRRPANEDAVIVETLGGDRDLIAVADGMGGHAGGEIASRKALETLLQELESSNDLKTAIEQANKALLAAAEANPEWRGMGTTLVALLRVGAQYHVANVGDSRAYRLDNVGASRITEDHSFTAEAINSGRLSEDEAERSPWRNALTRAVGTDDTVEVDVFGPFSLDLPHMVVLCSDGLYRVISDQELAEELLATRTRPDGARDLVANALRRGSTDNISVAIVEFGDVSTLAPSGPTPKTPRRTGAPRTTAGQEPVEVSSRPEPPVAATQEQDAIASPASEPPEETAPDVVARPASEAPERRAPDVVTPPASGSPVERAPSGESQAEKPRSDAPTARPAVSDPPAGLPEAVGPTTPGSLGSRSDTPGQPAKDVGQGIPEFASPSGSASPNYRTARVARSSVKRRAAPRRSRQIPSWVKREGLPTLMLVGATLALVYFITQMLS